jgi:hypothetical protein
MHRWTSGSVLGKVRMEWAHRASGEMTRRQKRVGHQRFDDGDDLRWKVATGDET